MYGLKEEGPGKLELGGAELMDWKKCPVFGSSLNNTIAGCNSGLGLLVTRLGDGS